jgi:hypothetical protein
MKSMSKKMKIFAAVSLVCLIMPVILFFYFQVKVMKITNTSEKIMTTILLHGNQQYDVIVDTGAASSIIYKNTLRLIEDKSNGRLVKVDYNKNYAILLKNYFHKKNIRMVYTPDLKIQTEGDGIFGIDVLKLASYAVVNYKRKRIYLSNHKPSGFKWIPAVENEGLYCIELYIDGEPFNCILDTGSNLNEIYKRNTIPVSAVTTFPSTCTIYGKISKAAQKVCYIYEIKAGLNFLRRMPFYDSSSYADILFPGTWKPEVLLGTPFFNNYIVCFDFKHKQVGLKEIKQVEKK